MIRAVIDTNVVISAVLFGRELEKIIHHWQDGAFIFLLSEKTLKEYVKVLSYPKFGLFPQEVKRIIYEEILPWAETVKIREEIAFIKADPSDNIFLECAQEGKANYIVSGDRHLLSLKKFKKTEIITPLKFLSLFTDTSSGL